MERLMDIVKIGYSRHFILSLSTFLNFSSNLYLYRAKTSISNAILFNGMHFRSRFYTGNLVMINTHDLFRLFRNSYSYVYIFTVYIYNGPFPLQARSKEFFCLLWIYIKKKKYISSFRYTNWRFKILNRNWKTRNLIKIKHPTPYRNYRISSSF